MVRDRDVTRRKRRPLPPRGVALTRRARQAAPLRTPDGDSVRAQPWKGFVWSARRFNAGNGVPGVSTPGIRLPGNGAGNASGGDGMAGYWNLERLTAEWEARGLDRRELLKLIGGGAGLTALLTMMGAHPRGAGAVPAAQGEGSQASVLWAKPVTLNPL